MPGSHSIVRIRGLTSQWVVGQPQGLQSERSRCRRGLPYEAKSLPSEEGRE